jgi:polyhydroxyalkanoate synthesis regulator phasin
MQGAMRKRRWDCKKLNTTLMTRRFEMKKMITIVAAATLLSACHLSEDVTVDGEITEEEAKIYMNELMKKMNK